MRLGELLAGRVVAADGAVVGRIRDVQLVQDGPLVEGFGHSLRLDAVAVGAGGVLVRLGWRSAPARIYRWADVEGWDGEAGELRLREGAEPLG